MHRKRRSPEERARLVADYRASGLSQKAFAKKAGVKLATLQSCIYRPSGGQRAAQPRFVRVEPVVEPERDGEGVRLQLGNELVLHLAALPEPEFIARLVRALSC